MGWSIQIKAVGVLIIIQTLWISRVFPLAFSSLLLILILSIHFFNYEETLKYFGSSLVWLLFSTFILSYAFIQTGLASRVSLYILNLAKGSGKLLILVSFLMSFVLTLFIPSNLGKGTLISSILDDIVQGLKEIQPTSNLGKSLFIGLAYVSSIAAAFVPTGASSTIYAFDIFKEISDKITYFRWILYFGPPIILFIFILWLILNRFFPLVKVDVETVSKFIEDKLKIIGRWRTNEIKIAIIIGGTLALWLTQPLHGYSIPLVGLLGACLSILPKVGVIEWDEAKKGVSWDLMIFFASTLMLSNMLIDTGTIDVFVTFLIKHINGLPTTLVIVGLILFTALIRIVFVNVLGFLTIMLPLATSLGNQMPDVSPLILGMVVYLAGVPGFLLITQSPVHLISFSYGHFIGKDLFRVGALSLIIWVTFVLLSAFLYWNILI